MAKKTSVRITGIGQARDNALKFLNNQFKDSQFLKEMGEQSVHQIQAAVRGRQDAYKQPPLKKSTIESRKSYAEGNQPGFLFKPAQSNLTMSGQLLESISFKINAASSEIILFLKDARQKIYHASKTNKKEIVPTNTEVRKDLEKRGRRFFFISAKVQTLLENLITKRLRTKLNDYNKVLRRLK